MAEVLDDLNPRRELDGLWRRWIARAEQVFNSGAHGSLDHWAALARDRNDDPESTPNSLQAAECLLVLLYPHWALSDYRFDRLDRPGEAAPRLLFEFGASRVALEPVREFRQLSLKTQERILSLLEWFFTTYRTADTNGLLKPDFRAASYLNRPKESAQTDEEFRNLAGSVDITDAYTFSVTLSLIVKYLGRRWAEDADDIEVKRRCNRISEMASDRLTAALMGLCDSFCVVTTSVEKWSGFTKVSWPKGRLRPVRERLSQLLRASGLPEIDDRSAFECGWTWSRTDMPMHLAGAEKIRAECLLPQTVHAEGAPYFYFTLSAVDGISDLFSPEVETAELLSAEQLLLSSRLKQLWDISSEYWATIATEPRLIYGKQISRRWAVQLPPWSAADGDDSDYWSLSLGGLLVNAMRDGRIEREPDDIERLTELFEELAQRARVNREPSTSDDRLDPSIEELVVRGKVNTLRAAGDKRDLFEWPVLDFVPQLLKRTAQLMSLSDSRANRRRLEYLAHEVWSLHLLKRRIASGQDKGLWDNVLQLDPVERWFNAADGSGNDGSAPMTGPSWYMTERVVEAVVAFRLADRPKAPDTESVEQLIELVRDSARYRLENNVRSSVQRGHNFEDELKDLDAARDASSTDAAGAFALMVLAVLEIQKKAAQEDLSRDTDSDDND